MGIADTSSNGTTNGPGYVSPYRKAVSELLDAVDKAESKEDNAFIFCCIECGAKGYKVCNTCSITLIKQAAQKVRLEDEG
jgi:hypothetical protein